MYTNRLVAPLSAFFVSCMADFGDSLSLVPFTNMSTLSYRTECTIMSLAAAIQVM